MSGGYFDHENYALDRVADDIECAIRKNSKVGEFGECRNYSDDTIDKFITTINSLRKLSDQIKDIDWLLSGDIGEDDFLKRWKE